MTLLTESPQLEEDNRPVPEGIQIQEFEGRDQPVPTSNEAPEFTNDAFDRGSAATLDDVLLAPIWGLSRGGDFGGRPSVRPDGALGIPDLLERPAFDASLGSALRFPTTPSYACGLCERFRTTVQ